MPVFIKGQARVLFIHVPKTGGTAVEFFFEKNGWDISFVDRGGDHSLVPVMHCSPQHLHADVLQQVFRLKGFSYMFMTVRNPLDRLVSEYRMRAHMQATIEDIDTWVEAVLGGFQQNPYLIDNHIRPQAEFWVPGCEVFKQEYGFGEAWVDHIASRVGGRFDHRQVGVEMRFDAVARPALSVAAMRRVREFYARDYELFAYEPPAV